MNRSTAIKLLSKKCQITLRNRAGSTLIWALIVTLVLGILIASGLVIAQSVVSRAQTQHTEKQAYYTALSVTRSIADWLTNSEVGTNNESNSGKSGDFIAQLRQSENRTAVKNINTSDYGLGDCVSTIRMDEEDNIIISSTATYNNQSSTVNATLKRSSESQIVDSAEWPDSDDFDNIFPSNLTEGGQGVSDGSYYAQRILKIELNKSTNNNRYLVTNDDGGNSSWNNNYFEIQTSGNTVSSDKNAFIKIENNSSSTRPFIFHSGNNFAGTYNRLVFYSRTKPVTAALRLTPVVTFRDVGLLFKGVRLGDSKDKPSFQTASIYNNLTLYIDDGQNSELQLCAGVTLNNTIVYTTRPTSVGRILTSSDEVESILLNNNYMGYISGFNKTTSVNGTFVVKNKKTTFLANSTFSGKLLVDGSSSVLTTTNGNTITKGTDATHAITVKNGGTANLYSKVTGNINIESGTVNLENGANIIGDIYVQPNARLNIKAGATVKGNIFAYNDDSKGGTLTMNGSATINPPDGITANDSCGIFLEGDKYGATFTQTSNFNLTSPAKVHAPGNSKYSYGSGYNKMCDGGKDCLHFGEVATIEIWTLEGYTTGK